MHHIYQTKAFVLKSFPYGEYNKIIVLLTEDFGVIRVVCQAVRKIESKLRQSIQDYSLTKVAVVHGKTGWRLTNASIEKNLFHDLPSDQFEILARIFSLVDRLIPEEDHNNQIFQAVQDTVDLLRESPKIDLDSVEIAAVLKIVHDLGYVGEDSILHSVWENPIDAEQLALVKNNRKHAVSLINNAIKESHL